MIFQARCSHYLWAYCLGYDWSTPINCRKLFQITGAVQYKKWAFSWKLSQALKWMWPMLNKCPAIAVDLHGNAELRIRIIADRLYQGGSVDHLELAWLEFDWLPVTLWIAKLRICSDQSCHRAAADDHRYNSLWPATLHGGTSRTILDPNWMLCLHTSYYSSCLATVVKDPTRHSAHGGRRRDICLT